MDTLTRILHLKNELKLSDLALERELGLTSRIVAGWKSGKSDSYMKIIPQIAKTLHTSSSYLLCETDNPTPPNVKGEPPVLNEKDKRDVAREVEKIMNDLEHSGDLMFDGDPMSKEAKESMRAAMMLGLEAAKLKNKEKYTPKKYRGNGDGH